MEDSDCSSSSYYECFASEISYEEMEKELEAVCLPETIKSIGKVEFSEFETCDKSSDQNKIWDFLYTKVYQNLHDNACPKLCKIQEYSGKIDYNDDKTTSETETNTLLLHLRYSRPHTVTLSEEYLIYDSIGMVGSVGGTLGMFMGFSFYDVVVRIGHFFR